jgi:4-hydroxy-4-methyl-2-oxoglutarate aldolase
MNSQGPEPAPVGTPGLAGLPTSAISDALDRLGIPGQLPGILPVARSMRCFGRAFTVQYEPVGETGGTVGDFVDDVSPDEVLVLDNQGRANATVWGDILTWVAHERGLQGTVINGVCRDTSLICDINYPVFSTGRWMRTGKDRVRLRSVNSGLLIGGVAVAPGDLVIGDDDGVVVVPAGRAGEVASAAAEIEAAEDRIRELVSSGTRLAEARRQLNYHALQSRLQG